MAETPRFCFAIFSVRSEIPSAEERCSNSSEVTSPLSSISRINFSTCSVFVILGPLPERSSLAVVSQNPFQVKPLSEFRENKMDCPSGARLLLSWTTMRILELSFERPTSSTLRAAARKSIEPIPRYADLAPCILFMCPIRMTAQPVCSAILQSRLKIGRISLARCISTPSPRYAWIGSRTTNPAFVS